MTIRRDDEKETRNMYMNRKRDKMRKNQAVIGKWKRAAVVLGFEVLLLSGCGTGAQDPGEPPAEVLYGGSTGTENADTGNGNTDVEKNTPQAESGAGREEAEILAKAVSVRIGREGVAEWNVDMYNNDAAQTMLNYLSDSALLFPTYTYDEEGGFVAQNVRGNYTRDDERTIADVKTGELYLFSGGQLRFYFKDMEGANIIATPIGYYTDVEELAEAVQEAYTANLEDTWGVDVYFWLTKTLE